MFRVVIYNEAGVQIENMECLSLIFAATVRHPFSNRHDDYICRSIQCHAADPNADKMCIGAIQEILMRVPTYEESEESEND